MFRSISLLGACLLLSAMAIAQPDETPSKMVPSPEPGAPRPKAGDIVVSAQNMVGLHVFLREAPVVEAVQTIAARGNLQLVIKKGVSGTIANLELSGSSPENALISTCKAAHLSVETHGGVWFVSPAKAPEKPADTPLVDSMEFRAIEAADLLKILSEHFNVAVRVAPEVKGDIPLIHLNHVSPREAIEAVAEAVDAFVTQEPDGGFVVSPKPKPVIADNVNNPIIDGFGPTEAEATELLKVISEQFNVPTLVEAGVKGKARTINLSGKTPRQAIEIVAKTIDATLTQAPDGTFIISP